MNTILFALLPVLGCLAKTLPEGYAVDPNLETLTIADGNLLGTKNTTQDKKKAYYAFRGIPYAQPPINDLRFAAPVRNSKWAGYWDATRDAEECIQGSGDDVRGTEDCLYINVYTSSLSEKKQLPVMVWIHGGGFVGGNSRYELFNPDYLLEQDVVYVSFNYRLGVFGFLSTEDKTISGNWGLKDQVLALEWVRDNIKKFGGDPKKVTIFGESAGAASVSYLLQSPKAQGLFHAAIMQSGTSEMLWSLNTRGRDIAFRVGRGVGVLSLFASTLLKQLRTTDAYKLQKAAMSTFSQVFLVNPFSGLPFSPVIEEEHEGALFTQKSDDYFRSGQFPNKVPVLMGHNTNEAGSAHGLAELFRSYLLLADVNTNILAPINLSSTSKLRNLAASEIKTYFFGVNSIRSQLVPAVDFINIDQFTRATRRVAENIAPYVSVYLYVFGYEGSGAEERLHPGVGHGEHMRFLFRDSGYYSAQDKKVSSKLVTLFTNFAKSQNPTPSKTSALDNVIWKPINAKSSEVDFLWINSTLTVGKNPDQERYSFYDYIFSQFGDGSYSTY